MLHEQSEQIATAVGFDQSRLGLSLMGASADELNIGPADREILRRLAGEVADLAARPIEAEKRELWSQHNDLRATRPVIFCDPENGWTEIIPSRSLRCQHWIARSWEMTLRKEVFWGTQMGDDYVIESVFNIPHVYAELNWGLKEKRVGGELGGTSAIRWESPIKSIDDIEKLHFPKIQVDRQATQRLVDLAQSLLGDLLQVRLKTVWWWSLGMTLDVAFLRGLDHMMYDFIENPELVHRLMAFLRDGNLAMLDQLEQQDLLSLNTDGYVGSGGLGYTRELPQPDFRGKVRTKDMWGFAESQETTSISPRMFAEFILPYQLPLLERFGLNCYGCCEPLDKRWEAVRRIPRLRRVSVSAWADWARMAELLGDRYIFSMKPRPADLAMPGFDEGQIRADLRQALQVTRDCRVEVIMKDNHTINNDPQRVTRWAQIAKEEAENL